MKHLILISFFVLSFTMLNGQQMYPAGAFSSPLFLPFNLAGNFGEIRSNHFHSGIDIKTNEQEGEVVMAADSGYISRIKISAVGFGKALYINHPNGFTTVYGHLQGFNERIASYTDSVQNALQSFEIDVLPDSNLFPVNQGQLIAFSGNTGGSDGPHLHFEIRNQKTEHPINPLLFGFHLEDTIPPVIQNIKAYQLDQTDFGLVEDTSFIWNDTLAKDTLFVYEKTAFSIDAFDLMSGSDSHLGIDKIELLLDNKIIYIYHFSEFGFDETNYVNAQIDYAAKINDRKTYTLLYRLPGNKFSMYNADTLMTGIITINDDKLHNVEIKATDLNGNATVRKINLIRSAEKPAFKNSIINISNNKFISYRKAPLIRLPEIKVSFPSQPAVYNVYPFVFKTEKKLKGTYAPLYTVGDATIPLNASMLLSLKPSHLPVKYISKAVIVSFDKNENMYAVESNYLSGWVTGKVRYLGKFTVALDTLPPQISQPEIVTDTMTNKLKMVATISDNLSGIKSYRATMDGNWVVMEYDAKTNTLSYEIKDVELMKKSDFTIEVTDKKNNTAKVKANWEY